MGASFPPSASNGDRLYTEWCTYQVCLVRIRTSASVGAQGAAGLVQTGSQGCFRIYWCKGCDRIGWINRCSNKDIKVTLVQRCYKVLLGPTGAQGATGATGAQGASQSQDQVDPLVPTGQIHAQYYRCYWCTGAHWCNLRL